MEKSGKSAVLAALCINSEGESAATLLGKQLPGLTVHRSGQGELPALTAKLFPQVDGLIFFCATGIAVRMIAPLVQSKYRDPAVVIVDNGCRFAVSLLSGHEGGANRLCETVSRILGALPVVSTATEAKKQLVLGIGARRDLDAEVIKNAVTAMLKAADIPLSRIRTAATIGKKCLEPGLVQAMTDLGLPLMRITAERIRTFAPAFSSSAAERHFNLPSVAEPCALLASREGILLLPMRKMDGVTIAVATERVGPLKLEDEA
jgi:cobalamin biosynthesis protein CbiG